MRTLITGTNSGFGKYLKERYENPICITRASALPPQEMPLDLIIHCAADPRHTFPRAELEEYWYSNFGLLSQLLQLRSKYFVFISSIDCAPFDDNITPSANAYVFTKLVQEMAVQSVRKMRGQYLILRPSMLIGPGMRENSITKSLKGEPVRVSQESEFNCVSYDDVYGLISTCHEQGTTGTLTVGSTDSVKLKDIAAAKCSFGQYVYTCPKVDASKAYEIYPGLRKTSGDMIREYTESQYRRNNVP